MALACERCDFAATLWERIPYALDAEGHAYALVAATEAERRAPTGYWSDWLCGSCLAPVRLPVLAPPRDDAPMEPETPTCPRCQAPLLSFALASEELALASHSRAWLDLRAEREALRRLRAAQERLPALEDGITAGESTTQDALDELIALLTERTPTTDESTLQRQKSPMPDATLSFAGLAPLIENAATLGDAARTLRERETIAERQITTLEELVAKERELPGVPCPRCNSQLIHWPVWD